MLGDDIVIANYAVAKEYLVLMDHLGVAVGLAKSLVSKNATCEFAKRTFFEGVDVSPMPVKEYVSATMEIAMLPELIRKYRVSLGNLLAGLGYGYKVMGSLESDIQLFSNRVRNIGILYYSKVTTLSSMVQWFRIKSFDVTGGLSKLVLREPTELQVEQARLRYSEISTQVY